MAVESVVAGVPVGLERPAALLIAPVGVAAVWWLLRGSEERGLASRRRRRLLFAGRAVILLALVVALAAPYTVQAHQTTGEPSVTMLVDRSDSAAVTENMTGELATGLEQRGVAVDTRVVAEGDSSPIGDAVAASLAPNATVLVASDGRVTEGQSLAEAAALARSVNATISAVAADVDTTERYVRVDAPQTATAGVETQIRVRVGGVALGDERVPLTVAIDGERVLERRVGGEETVTVNRSFDDVGSHRVTARLETDDRFDRNDVFRRTTSVVSPPSLLYVADRRHRLGGFLNRLYDVDVRQSIPEDLSGYHAVVVQDQSAGELRGASRLRRAVANGTGLLTVGGPSAFRSERFADSPLADVVPVERGKGRSSSDIVLAVDVSGSTDDALATQKALALDVIDQLGDQNRVGLVAFTGRAYGVAEPRRLASSRERLREQVRRLQSGRGTQIATGLSGAAQMLGSSGGTVVLISDGNDHGSPAVRTAERLSAAGTRVVTVGVGDRVNAGYLRRIAAAGGGTYLRATETDRLRLRFGDDDRQYSGDRLTVVDGDHFVTEGVRFSTDLPRADDVSVEPRADYLVATGSGRPAMAAWRFGLGRSVAITAHGEDGGVGALTTRPDSRALTRAVNWAVGDPRRLATDVVEAPDGRVGAPTTITYRGDERPRTDAADFVRADAGRYRAPVVPESRGYHSILGTEYAANYPREYGAFGTAPALERAVESTGGRVFEAGDTAAVAEHARERARRTRTDRRDWAWLAALVALLAFLVEVSGRRLLDVRERRDPT